MQRILSYHTHSHFLKQYHTSEEELIPKGTNVVLMIDGLHRVEEFWDKPDQFNPERFNPENSRKRDPYTYIPFSVGMNNE